MHDHQMNYGLGTIEIGIACFYVLLLMAYTFAGIVSSKSKRLRKWPTYRYFLWFAGILCVAVVWVGPLADMAHYNFIIHMFGHLLLGMLGPLLLALSAPMTLLLRILPVSLAKKVTVFFRSSFASFVSHPITASLLNFGGLWILYATDLFHFMHQNMLVYIIIHLHVLLAGYVFTISMIYIDPVARRYSYLFRSIVFILALGSHAILAKYIYANPPNGVPIEEAQIGGMLMYYGGDVIDAIIIVILCYQWYQTSRTGNAIILNEVPR